MHEHVPEMDMIDMNGRLYDPVLCQFLSPDPYIQYPDNWQNYNRYGYCLQNPMLYTDPSGEFLWIPVIIGAIVGTYMGGTLANGGKMNPTKWDYSAGRTWGYMLGGSLVGAASGAACTFFASSEIPFGATIGIAVGSFVNSVGTTIYTGGQYQSASISFGACSYDLLNNEFGYIGKDGNSTMENIGYGLGALANLSDVLVGLHPGEVELQTEMDGVDPIGHSQLVDDVGKNLVDFGPERGGDFYKFNQGRNNWTEYANYGRVTQVKNIEGNIFNKGITIRGVNLKRIIKISNKLNQNPGRYNFLMRSCSSVAARTLTVSGVPMIGLHPYLLHAQANLWSVGIRPWSFNNCFFIK